MELVEGLYYCGNIGKISTGGRCWEWYDGGEYLSLWNDKKIKSV